MPNKNVTIQLDIVTDTAKIQEATSNVKSLDEQMQKLREDAAKTEEAFSKLQSASAATAAAGAALFAPILLSAQKYVEKYKDLEVAANKYYQVQQRQTEAQIAFGRKAAEALLPLQETLLNLLEMVARLDPSVIQAATGVGVALTLVGAIGVLVGQIGIFASQAVALVAALNANTAGQAGRLGVAGLAVGAGVVGGIGATRAIGEATDNDRLKDYGLDDAFLTLKQVLVAFADGLVNLIGLLMLADAAYKGFNQDILTAGQVLVESAKVVKLEFEGAWSDLLKAIETGGVNFLATLGTLIEGLGNTIKKIPGLGGEGRELAEQGRDLQALTANLEKYTQADARRQAELQNASDKIDELLNSFGDWITPEDAERIANTVNELRETLVGGLAEKLFPEIKPSANAIVNTPINNGITPELAQQLDLFEQYTQETEQIQSDSQARLLEAEKKYQSEIEKLQSDFNKSQIAKQAQHQKDLDKLASDYKKAESAATKEHNKRITDLQKQLSKEETDQIQATNSRIKDLQDSYQKEELNRQADFNKERQRAEADHLERLLSAASNFDAAGVYRELTSFNKDSTRAKEDFASESTRRAEDIKKQVDAEKQALQVGLDQRRQAIQEQLNLERVSYAEAQAERRADYENTRKERIDNYNLQRRIEADNYRQTIEAKRQALQQQIKQEQTALQQQLKLREQSFRAQIDQLNSWGAYEIQARQNHYNRLKEQLNAFLRAGNQGQVGNSLGNLKPFATGGYLPDGPVRTHQGEYALTAKTTQALERLVGGRLTQDSLQNLANQLSNISNSTTSNSYSLPVTQNFGGVVNPEQVARIVRHTIKDILAELGAS